MGQREKGPRHGPGGRISAMPLPSRLVDSEEVTSLLDGGLRERITRLHVLSAPVVIGIAGSVAAGKSTFAAALVEGLSEFEVEVVGTDGFLHSNAVLAERQIESRKGFPESYDESAVVSFIDALHRGDESASVPVYSHTAYDVVVGERRVIGSPDICIIEGVNALQFGDHLDLAIYLDADEGDLINWYATRFSEICDAAVDDPTSFYSGWSLFPENERREMAESFWYGINHPNLLEYIAPSAAHADLVVRKTHDHSISSVEWRA